MAQLRDIELRRVGARYVLASCAQRRCLLPPPFCHERAARLFVVVNHEVLATTLIWRHRRSIIFTCYHVLRHAATLTLAYCLLPLRYGAIERFAAAAHFAARHAPRRRRAAFSRGFRARFFRHALPPLHDRHTSQLPLTLKSWWASHRRHHHHAATSRSIPLRPTTTPSFIRSPVNAP